MKRFLALFLATILVISSSLSSSVSYASEGSPEDDSIIEVLDDDGNDTSEADLDLTDDIRENEQLDQTPDEDISLENDLLADDSDIASGSYEKTTWRIDKDGTLIVSGTGEVSMLIDSSYTEQTRDQAPWISYCDKIVAAKISLKGTKNFSSFFSYCKNLKSVDLSGTDTSKATDMHSMFEGCSSLQTINFGAINTHNVTNMHHMFAYCESLKELDLSIFDTSNVERMDGLFAGDSFESIDFNCLNTSKVTNMASMFAGYIWGKDADVKLTFDTSNVVNMKSMFGGSWLEDARSIDITAFNTQNVEHMENMFYMSHAESINCSNLNVSKVIEMFGMFESCINLKNLNISGWNTESLMYAGNMFRNCNSLESFSFKDLNVSKVVNMQRMFESCESLEKVDVDGIDTGKVSDFSLMFHGCSSLTDIDTSEFNTENAIFFDSLFEECNSLSSIDISGWVMNYPANKQRKVSAEKMFSYTGLKYVYLPDSLEKIHYEMFESTGRLKHVYYTGSKSDWDAMPIEEGNESLKEATIHYNYNRYSCGDDASWDFSEDGTLTISGSGHMMNFTYNDSDEEKITIPWWKKHSQINTLVVEKGIESIGSYSFINHENLTQVYLPVSVKQIRESAFLGTQVKDVYYAGSETDWNNIEFWKNNDPIRSATIHYLVKDLRITKIKSPTGYKYKYDNSLHRYTFFIPEDVSTISLDIDVSTGASWEIYKDASCTDRTDSHKLTLISPYDNNFFVKVWNLDEYIIYTFRFRHGSPDAMDSALVDKNIYYYVDNYTKASECHSLDYETKWDTQGGSMNLGGFYEPVKWGGKLFEHVSSVPNRQLALTAGALSAAAEGKTEYPLDGRDGDYILQAYKDLGFSDGNVYLFSYPGSSKNLGAYYDEFADDSRAFSIAYSPIWVNDMEYNLLVVTVRGSMTAEEYLADAITASEWSSTFHRSVYCYVAAFEEEINIGFEYVLAQHPEIKKDKSRVIILINGHSLGGAAANLFAVRMNSSGYANKNNIYAYTYGGINSFYADETNSTISLGYENIHNIYNFWDSYGPRVKGRQLPSGAWTMKGRYGHIDGFGHIFAKDDDNVAGTAWNHIMAGYLYGIRNDLIGFEKRSGRWCVTACPVDVEVYNNGNLVGRIKDNEVDESVTTIPMYVIDDVKHYLLPEDGNYEVKITATSDGEMSCSFEDLGGDDAQIKVFGNIELTKGKVIETEITDEVETDDTALFVLDENGEPTKEILENGTEINYSMYGEVLPEDVPESGIIPDGIWIGGVKSLTYDGTKQLQSFRVYDGTDLLVPNTDYKVTYKNNQNAYVIDDLDKLSANELKAVPQVALAMKGNYSGKKSFYFSIDPLSIEDEKAFATVLKKSGKTNKPALIWNGKELKKDKDYTLLIVENAATFTGIGNFKGTRVLDLSEASVAPKQIAISKVKVSAIPAQLYTGQTYGTDSLKEADGVTPFDFAVTYDDKKTDLRH